MNKSPTEKDVLEMRDDVDRLLDHAKAVCVLSRCVAEDSKVPVKSLTECLALVANLISEAHEVADKLGELAMQGKEVVHA